MKKSRPFHKKLGKIGLRIAPYLLLIAGAAATLTHNQIDDLVVKAIKEVVDELRQPDEP